MTKQKALKAVEDLKNNDEPMKKRKRKQIDYAVLANKTFRVQFFYLHVDHE